MDADEQARQLATESLSAHDPTGWFEQLYEAAERGEAEVPWGRGEPHGLLVAWARERQLHGGGRRALVVGFGLGDDAEFVAELGFDTVAFDIAHAAVRAARARFPASPVSYRVADLLDPPAQWRGEFDLIVEIMTVQSLPVPWHPIAITNIGRMLAPGGTLLAIAMSRDAGTEPEPGPPWPLTRAEVDAFAADGSGLRAVRIEHLRDATRPGSRHWRAEFHRPEPVRRPAS